MDATPMPSGSGENQAGYLLSVTWVQCAISAVFVASRFYCRIKLTRSLWWDDWSILVPFFCIVVASCTISVYTHVGGTKHVFDLLPAQIASAVEWNLISLVFCIGSICSGKISVALLIYRLQAPSRWRTWLLWFLSVSSVVVAVLIIGLEFAQCTPVQKLWIPTLDGSCWDPKKVNDWDIAGSCYWALEDLLLAVIPVTFLWNLKVSAGRKLALCVLLGLGLFAAICGAIKASYLPTLTAQSDITWITVSLLIWNVTEANVIIYAACLPTIRPLLKRSFDTISPMTRRGATKGGSALGARGGGSSNVSQHIKLSSVDRKEHASQKSYGRTEAWESPSDDNDSDKAHILKPDHITKSIQVEIRSQKEAGTVTRNESWAGNLERGPKWDRSAV